MQNLINPMLSGFFRVSVACVNSPLCEVFLLFGLHFLTAGRHTDFSILQINEQSVKIAGCNLSLCC